MNNAYEKGSLPYVQWNHIDGPLLHLRNGELYWLSWWDRIQLRLKWTDVYALESKYRKWKGLR